ncbi:HotDog domain-containing protein [Roridomyces roridus]|uniref:HotDog domain-containing protein n=1 Tax=Roridomyces roridus TaxID=1738132 RepID=A0AAD7C8N2_9AGAR|nr:HotDog domain-containing protein [Roridomyces roridus]
MSSVLLRHGRPLSRLSRTQFLARTTSTTPPPRRSFSLGPIATASLVAAVSLGAYTVGSIYPPSALTLLYPRPAPALPANLTSPEALAHVAALEAQLQSLPLLTTHRARADTAEWYETRPHANLPEPLRSNKLTPGALAGPGRLALLPLARVRRDESEAVIFVHLGRGLCGHDGIIHGGLLATLLDEALARNSITNLPDKVAVTATMNLKYKAPTRADQFVVIKTRLVELRGRKAFVAGQIEDLSGTVLVEADALFVQPRYAKLLNKNIVQQQLGGPETAVSPPSS